MRWPAFFIFAYLTVALQAALGGHFVIAGAQPNLVLILAAFIALYAPRQTAIAACFALGLMHDLITVQRFGLFALSYTLLAGLVGGYFGGTNASRRNVVLCAMITLLGGIIAAIVVFIFCRLPFTHETRVSLATLLWSGVYSSLVSVIVVDLILNRVRSLFAFESARRRTRF